MDFDQAIAAHSAWKTKLRDYLSKRDGSLKSAEVSLDNKCLLGQWIYGEGSQYSRLPGFAALKNEHARFHNVAADVVRKADSGEAVTGEVAMGSRNAFAATSGAVVMAIIAMKKQVQAK